MGTRYNRLVEVILTCTHNICFEQKCFVVSFCIFFPIKFSFFSSEKKSLYIAWASLHNAKSVYGKSIVQYDYSYICQNFAEKRNTHDFE